MEVYRRITERVRGALWAHHRRLMPERQFHRILAYVYNNKYEHQIRFDKMEVVGTEWEGKIEVVTTPAGFLKRVRVNPCVEDLTQHQRDELVLSAYHKACAEGRALMEKAELNIYKQFLKDLKPIVMGIRDNPEFYTVPQDSIESMGATLRKEKPSLANGGGVGEDANLVHRTIPAARAHQPSDEVRARHQWEQQWMQTPQGQDWARSLRGKEYFARHGPQYRPRGTPGAKTRAKPFELLAPYTPMDEGRLLKKNWMAYMDNKHVAESLWTRSNVADREKKLRQLQERGQAWHRPIHSDAVDRCSPCAFTLPDEHAPVLGSNDVSPVCPRYLSHHNHHHHHHISTSSQSQLEKDDFSNRMQSNDNAKPIKDAESAVPLPPPLPHRQLASSTYAETAATTTSLTARDRSLTLAESPIYAPLSGGSASPPGDTLNGLSALDDVSLMQEGMHTNGPKASTVPVDGLSPSSASKSGIGGRFCREETYNHLTPRKASEVNEKPVDAEKAWEYHSAVEPVVPASSVPTQRRDSTDSNNSSSSSTDSTRSVSHTQHPMQKDTSVKDDERVREREGARASPSHSQPRGQQHSPSPAHVTRGLRFLDIVFDEKDEVDREAHMAFRANASQGDSSTGSNGSGCRPPSLAPDPSTLSQAAMAAATAVAVEKESHGVEQQPVPQEAKPSASHSSSSSSSSSASSFSVSTPPRSDAAGMGITVAEAVVVCGSDVLDTELPTRRMAPQPALPFSYSLSHSSRDSPEREGSEARMLGAASSSLQQRLALASPPPPPPQQLALPSATSASSQLLVDSPPPHYYSSLSLQRQRTQHQQQQQGKEMSPPRSCVARLPLLSPKRDSPRNVWESERSGHRGSSNERSASPPTRTRELPLQSRSIVTHEQQQQHRRRPKSSSASSAASCNPHRSEAPYPLATRRVSLFSVDSPALHQVLALRSPMIANNRNDGQQQRGRTSRPEGRLIFRTCTEDSNKASSWATKEASNEIDSSNNRFREERPVVPVSFQQGSQPSHVWRADPEVAALSLPNSEHTTSHSSACVMKKERGNATNSSREGDEDFSRLSAALRASELTHGTRLLLSMSTQEWGARTQSVLEASRLSSARREERSSSPTKVSFRSPRNRSRLVPSTSTPTSPRELRTRQTGPARSPRTVSLLSSSSSSLLPASTSKPVEAHGQRASARPLRRGDQGTGRSPSSSPHRQQQPMKTFGASSYSLLRANSLQQQASTTGLRTASPVRVGGKGGSSVIQCYIHQPALSRDSARTKADEEVKTKDEKPAPDSVEAILTRRRERKRLEQLQEAETQKKQQPPQQERLRSAHGSAILGNHNHRHHQQYTPTRVCERQTPGSSFFLSNGKSRSRAIRPRTGGRSRTWALNDSTASSFVAVETSGGGEEDRQPMQPPAQQTDRTNPRKATNTATSTTQGRSVEAATEGPMTTETERRSPRRPTPSPAESATSSSVLERVCARHPQQQQEQQGASPERQDGAAIAPKDVLQHAMALSSVASSLSSSRRGSGASQGSAQQKPMPTQTDPLLPSTLSSTSLPPSSPLLPHARIVSCAPAKAETADEAAPMGARERSSTQPPLAAAHLSTATATTRPTTTIAPAATRGNSSNTSAIGDASFQRARRALLAAAAGLRTAGTSSSLAEAKASTPS